jgi:CO dehydrogenase flavoprotein C-terminal domain
VPAVAARSRATYLKRMHPASGHAMLGVAVTVTFDDDQTCRDCRIAVTGAAAVATRVVRAEAQLAGSRLTPQAIQAAANAAGDGVEFIGDAFGSAAYLAELLPVYVTERCRSSRPHPVADSTQTLTWARARSVIWSAGVPRGGPLVAGAESVAGAPRHGRVSASVNPSRSSTVTVSSEWPLRRSGDGTFSRKWMHTPALAFVPNVSPSSIHERRAPADVHQR